MKCSQCSKEAVYGGKMCQNHLTLYKERARDRTGSKAWKKGSRGRPPIGSTRFEPFTFVS